MKQQTIAIIHRRYVDRVIEIWDRTEAAEMRQTKDMFVGRGRVENKIQIQGEQTFAETCIENCRSKKGIWRNVSTK